MTELLTGYCHLKGHLFKLELVDSPGCDRCRQAIEITSRVLCNSEAVAVLRFGQLCHHFPKLYGIANISLSKALHFVQSVGLLNAKAKAAQKNRNSRYAKVTAVPTPMYHILFLQQLHYIHILKVLFYAFLTMHPCIIL